MTTEHGQVFEVDHSGRAIAVRKGVGGPEYTFLDDNWTFEARATWSTAFNRPVIITHHGWDPDEMVMIHVPLLDHEPVIPGFGQLDNPCEYTEAVRCNYRMVHSEDELAYYLTREYSEPLPYGEPDDPAL